MTMPWEASINAPLLPTIILVNPQMPENIGAVARAMKNCGFAALRLVNPREHWPHDAAIAMAAGADDILAKATLHSSLAEALADHHFALATTARPRRMIKPVFGLAEAAAIARRETLAANRVALVFGAERTGLNNEDVARCDAILTIDLNPAYASLNIAQAVLLVAHECWRLWHTAAPVQADARRAPHGAVEHFMSYLDEALTKSGFLRVPEKRDAMLRNIRAVVHRAALRPHELQTLHGIVRSLQRPRT